MATEELVAGVERGVCAGCGATASRRDFVCDAVMAAVAALVTVCGADPLEAVEFGWARSLRTVGLTRSYPLPVADGVQIDREGEVIVVRWRGAAYAFALSCPHQRTALRRGGGSRRFHCPTHRTRHAPGGSCVSGRPAHGVGRYAVSREGTTLAVDVGRLFHRTENATAWSAAFVRV